jgi:UDPglucose 6-dehydrogenase
MPIYEPGLEELVVRNQHEERLTFTTDLPSSVQASEIVFIAVGTPQGEDGAADLQHVLGVASEIGRAMNKYTVVVDKSTVPVGTRRRCARRSPRDHAALQRRQQPEFLKQGAAIEDFMKPDRVVIGVERDERARRVMRSSTRRSRAPARRS